MAVIRLPICVATVVCIALASSSGLAQMTPSQGLPQQIGASQIQLLAAAQQYQVLLVQSNAALTGMFVFTPTEVTAEAAASGMSGGIFTAELEGQLFMGQFMTLDVGGASLWIAQGASGQATLVTIGSMTPEMLVGQASVSVGGDTPMPGITFFMIGQAVMTPLATGQVQGAAAATSPVGAPIIPAAPADARPSPGPDARPSSIFGGP